MLLLSEVVRGGGTSFGSYVVDGEGPFDAAVTEAKMRAGAIKVLPADEDTLDAITAWHRQNGRLERAAEIEAAHKARGVRTAEPALILPDAATLPEPSYPETPEPEPQAEPAHDEPAEHADVAAKRKKRSPW